MTKEIPRTFLPVEKNSPFEDLLDSKIEWEEGDVAWFSGDDIREIYKKAHNSVELTPELEADIEKDFEEVMKTHVVYDGFFLCKGHCCSEYHELSVTHWFFKKLEGLK